MDRAVIRACSYCCSQYAPVYWEQQKPLVSNDFRPLVLTVPTVPSRNNKERDKGMLRAVGSEHVVEKSESFCALLGTSGTVAKKAEKALLTNTFSVPSSPFLLLGTNPLRGSLPTHAQARTHAHARGHMQARAHVRTCIRARGGRP